VLWSGEFPAYCSPRRCVVSCPHPHRTFLYPNVLMNIVGTCKFLEEIWQTKVNQRWTSILSSMGSRVETDDNWLVILDVKQDPEETDQSTDHRLFVLSLKMTWTLVVEPFFTNYSKTHSYPDDHTGALLIFLRWIPPTVKCHPLQPGIDA